MMHSYPGRCLLSRMSYANFIGYLDTTMPDYMQTYCATGLLPTMANNNAVHVNEKIIPNMASGLIKVKPQAERNTGEGAVGIAISPAGIIVTEQITVNHASAAS